MSAESPADNTHGIVDTGSKGLVGTESSIPALRKYMDPRMGADIQRSMAP